MSSILDFVPAGYSLRIVQKDMLLQVERAYKTHDVIVLRAPTGSGKTLLALTIANWRGSFGEQTAYNMPTNVLVEQAKRAHPGIATLERKSAYHCEMFDRSCDETAKKCKRHCSDCPFSAAKKVAKKAPVVMQNHYVYWSHRAFVRNVIFDEGHTLLDTLEGMGHIKLWKKEFHFPPDLKTLADVISWLQHKRSLVDDKRISNALKDLLRIKGDPTIEYNIEQLRGRDEQVLHIKPQSIREIPDYLWPRSKVKKLFLMSATIGPHDIYDLGLDHRRVVYIDGDSPIPAANRPVIFEPSVNLAYKYIDAALPVLAQRIKALLDRYPDKGLIHLPYSLAQRLRGMLDHERLIYHDRDDKSAALNRFKAAPPESGKVLVASGLYEGVDLPYDLARWQIIAKVPYMSLAAHAVAKRAAEDPDWYAWQTIKRIIQAIGRITRAADDFGVTLILDSNFNRLWNEDSRRDPKARMFPQYIRDALKIVQPGRTI